MVLPPSPSHVSGKITWLSERLPRAMGNGGSLALWAGVLDLVLLCGLSNCLNVVLGVPLFLFVIVPKISIVSSKILPETVLVFFFFLLYGTVSSRKAGHGFLNDFSIWFKLYSMWYKF